MRDGFASICFRLYAYQFLGLPVLTKRLLSVSHHCVAFIHLSHISKSYEEIGRASLVSAIPLSLGDFMTFRFIGMDQNIVSHKENCTAEISSIDILFKKSPKH